MSDMDADNDFYEPDEPVDEVIMAFESAEKGLTRRPAQGLNRYLVIEGLSQVGRTIFESRNTVNLVTS